MAGKRIVELEIIRAGQPRPYADSVVEGYITFLVPEGQLWASRFLHQGDGHDREVVKRYIQTFGYSFDYDKEIGETFAPDMWHRPWLEKLEMVSPGRWRFKVMSPYLD